MNKLYYLAAACVVFVALVASYVVLSVHGIDTTPLLALGGPMLASLLVGAGVHAVTDSQNAVLAKIDRQTNGVLDARIRDGATLAFKAAAAELGLVPPIPVALVPEQAPAPALEAEPAPAVPST